MDLNDKLDYLITNFENKLKYSKDKKKYHFQSVLNISESLKKYNDQKAIELKKSMILYLETLQENGYAKPSEIDSHNNFTEYLFPSFLYLVNNEQYRSKSIVKTFTIVGFIIDIILFLVFNSYYYPIFTFLLVIISYYRNTVAKKEGRFASMYW